MEDLSFTFYLFQLSSLTQLSHLSLIIYFHLNQNLVKGIDFEGIEVLESIFLFEFDLFKNLVF